MALQAQQIVSLAAQIAGVPGFTAQAGQLLNSVLSDLCQTYDLDVAKKTTILTLGSTSGPYNLPADYLRSEYEEVFFTYNGVKYVLVPIDLAEYNLLVQQAGMQSYPSMYATDLSQSPPQLYVWPPPSAPYPLTVPYRSQMADIATPETSTTVPWFPNQSYLITRLAGELMKIADDTRADTYLGDGPSGAQGILDRFLRLVNDRTNRADKVRLDKRTFGSAFNKLPNTKVIGW